MLSLEKCSQVLNANGKNYKPEDVKQIRELLYQLGYIEYEQYIKNKAKKSNNLLKGINRGTSGKGL